MTTVTSGLKCYGLYAKSNPLSLFVKTLLGSSEWHSTMCYLTWKVKATPASRLLYQLAPSVPSTDETGYGSLLIAQTRQDQCCQQKKRPSHSPMLPTPTCQDGGKATKRWREKHQNNLTAYVFNPGKLIPTPAAADYKGAPKNRYQGSPTYKANLSEGVRLSESCSTHLNPQFLECVMGFPEGWTELKH